jgi:hypothetical protein
MKYNEENESVHIPGFLRFDCGCSSVPELSPKSFKLR